MKRNQLLVLSLLALGVQAISTGSALAEVTARGDIVETMPFPMDGDGPFNLPAIESFAERHADLGRNSERGAWAGARWSGMIRFLSAAVRLMTEGIGAVHQGRTDRSAVRKRAAGHDPFRSRFTDGPTRFAP